MPSDEARAPDAYQPEEREIADGLVSEAYDALLRIARAKRRRAGFSDTMLTEDVLHESFLKLSGKTAWRSQEHFLRTASLAMRQVIVDHARKQLSIKRGAGQSAVPLEEADGFLPEFAERPEEIVILNDLLTQLEGENPRWLRVVDARYFAGMTEAETAAVLGLSERTVRRDWQAARDWLAQKMSS